MEKSDIEESTLGQKDLSDRSRFRTDSGNKSDGEKSAKSDEYYMGFPTPRKSKFLNQTISFEMREGASEHETRCVLVFGSDRAPTGAKKGQGRHVSSSALLIEVIKAATNGLDVEDAVEAVVNLVREYGDESSVGMRQFEQFVAQRQGLLQEKGILTKAQRKDKYDKEIKVPKDLEESIAELETIQSTTGTDLSKTINDLKSQKFSVEEQYRILSPLDNRNKIKKADLWAHQECLVDVVKGALVTLNMMENAVFDGLVQKTRTELATEGGITTGVMGKYRRLGPDDDIDPTEVAQDMNKLFDYPTNDIITRARDENKTDAKIVEDFYQSARRHEKYFFDSFQVLNDLSEEDKNIIRTQFLKETLDEGGWLGALSTIQQQALNREYVEATYNQGIIQEEGKYKLVTKFNVNESPLLKAVLERRGTIQGHDLEDTLGYDDEQEKEGARPLTARIESLRTRSASVDAGGASR